MIIIIIHDLNLALQRIQWSIFLKDGKIISFGNTKDIVNSENIEQVYNVKRKIYNLENDTRIFIPSNNTK